jgi:predicted DNA-binding mobile mystery protein A
MSSGTINKRLMQRFMQLKGLPAAGESWIRALRTQRGMQGKQLAKRMQVSPARISVLERDEPRGAVTLKMMQKAADALDCDFVYALVPRAAPQQHKPRIRLEADAMQAGTGDKPDQL